MIVGGAMAEIAFLFPGQGSHQPGCAAQAAAAPQVADVLQRIDTVAGLYGYDPVTPLVVDPRSATLEDLLNETPNLIQLAVFADSMAVHAMLISKYERPPDAVLSHSFGDVAALTAAGALMLESATHVVCARMEAVARFAPPGGMTAMGMNAPRTAHLLAACADPRVVLAAENAPEQTVVSGPHPVRATVADAARACGVWTTDLPVPHPFHSPGFADAAHALYQTLRGVHFAPPRVPFYSDILARSLQATDNVAHLLSRTLVEPVRFLSTLRRLYADGITGFIECGARDILTGLLRQCIGTVMPVEHASSVLAHQHQYPKPSQARSHNQHHTTLAEGGEQAICGDSTPIDSPSKTSRDIRKL
ncbi:ACP S-malonyltransferase [Nonomuraea turkmeniaca]|uniref:ACP S-malonyltransferase n=1 Tax=Nonomuraea turkmeniaca TaxID=103838 RepID=A0A5S4FEY3_9ACTN|nr:ACP S-malonyltransferase [Nonomuraea turkmeniaca]TMR17525.1 ACP S-malonyltransferase [Nonomuraea turkmeniaca]